MSPQGRITEQDRSSGNLIALALQMRAGDLEREIAAAVADELDRLGVACRVVEDGDAGAMAAEVIWFISDGPAYKHYPSMLRGQSDRPRTLLWQMHPLPPVEMGDEAERAGLAAAAIREQLQRASQPRLKWLVGGSRSHRLRNWLYKQRSAPGYQQALRLMEAQPDWPWPDLDWLSVRGMMERDLWIRQAALEHRWLDAVCVSTLGRQQYLRRGGIEAVFAPVGWHPAFGGDGERRHRDINVLFLGRVAPGGRRARLLAEIERGLTPHGLVLHRAEADCYGRQRATLLRRAQVVLNLNKYPWDAPWLRFILAAGCGAVVVSEPLPATDVQPLVAGVHYSSAPPAELPPAIIRLLRDPGLIEALSRAAGDYVSSRLTMFETVRTLLRTSAGQSTASVADDQGSSV